MMRQAYTTGCEMQSWNSLHRFDEASNLHKWHREQADLCCLNCFTLFSPGSGMTMRGCVRAIRLRFFPEAGSACGTLEYLRCPTIAPPNEVLPRLWGVLRLSRRDDTYGR
ncbi:hypothetical protein AVEN_70032-1 [Araneus ventricosus]|uniref:Uncharacterized protein n=1 Tax=Araneus ventricosus TaxID=182803 RepID=A0A4Y2WPI9_ARAVE|nr:hypothetical protein AVEN_70032-1 [Araneus ventricosus]